MDVKNLGYDQFSMGIKTVWDQAESVWDVVDGGFNYVGAEFMMSKQLQKEIVDRSQELGMVQQNSNMQLRMKCLMTLVM